MIDRERTGGWRIAAAVALVAMVFVGGACSLKSGLEGQQCRPDQEGDRSEGRVCRGGYWVEAPDAGLTDGGPTDADDGQCYYNGEARGVCTRGVPGDDGGCLAPETYASTESRCADGLDNDCDGKADEKDDDCACSPGETESCYGGPPETEGVGECSAGTRTCNDDGSWGECKNETRPAEEDCSTPKDEDCGGDGNAGCACNFGGKEQGVCREATLGSDGSCREPDGYDSTDDEHKAGRCNDDLDNDCDGVVNEYCGCHYNGETTGVCSEGTIDPETGKCTPPAAYDATDDESAVGLCDSKDNDCDGVPDENCNCQNPGNTKSFYNGPPDTKNVGICKAGELTCQDDGSWKETEAEQTPKGAETCNDGKDSDCDGVPDNGCPCNYDGSGKGVCGEATKDGSGSCQEPSGYESTESTCADGVDNDCDGKADGADSDCQCNYDGSSAGVCGEATKNNSGSCQEPSDYESSETSCTDGADNDCDGAVDGNDTDCQCTYKGKSNGVCTDQTINSNGNCTEPSNYESSETSCTDGADNDCDGKADGNDTDCQCDYKGTSEGVCADQTLDSNGNCTEPSNYELSENSCNDGADNDCDGATDYDDIDCKQSAGSKCGTGKECYSGVCDGGNCAHRIFVSSETYVGDFGGLSDGDTTCDRLARNAGLKGNWQAVLSDSTTNVKDEITINAAIVRMDGKPVASGKQDLWGSSVSNPISIDETSSSVSTCGSCPDDYVWTGSDGDGVGSNNHCSDWSNANPKGDVGDAGDTGKWLSETDGPSSCGQKRRIYCIDGQP